MQGYLYLKPGDESPVRVGELPKDYLCMIPNMQTCITYVRDESRSKSLENVLLKFGPVFEKKIGLAKGYTHHIKFET